MTLLAVTVIFIFCSITQAPLDALDMVARHHEEHLDAFQQPPPLEKSHWSQTSTTTERTQSLFRDGPIGKSYHVSLWWWAKLGGPFAFSRL